MLEQAERSRYTGERRRTWKEAAVEWGKTAAEHLKPSVVKRYLVSLKQLRPFLDDLFIDEIDRKLVAKIARREGVSNATRRRDLTAVSAVLRWCVAASWREDNPAREWDRSGIRERRDPIALPREADVEAVIATAPGNFAKLIRWAQVTGMRQEECGSLQRSQVRGRAADLTKTKSGRARSVPLDDRAMATYLATLPFPGSDVMFWHVATDDEGRHRAERYRNIASRFAAMVARAGRLAAKDKLEFRRFRFHDLRHWYAVDYLRAGGSIYRLQKILGHSSVKVTELYLDFLTPDEQDEAKKGENGA